jgi:hypothetical protein
MQNIKVKNPDQDFVEMTKAEHLILQTLVELKRQVINQQEQIKELKTQNIQLKTKLTEVDNYMKTNLNKDELVKRGCEAIRKTTFAGEHFEGWAKEIAENFDGVAIYFEETQELMKKTADRIIKETVNGATANLSVSRRGGF